MPLQSPNTPKPPSSFLAWVTGSQGNGARLKTRVWGSLIVRLRVAFFSSMPFGAFKSNSCQIVLAHALDLETAVNFDRHTSVVAPYCTCWDAPSAKSDPGSSQAASRGVESPPKLRVEWP